MGQAQSNIANQQKLVVSEETTKSEFFSNIFMRLIKSSDILDIRALTSGPGSCGNYVILLEKNLEKEFKKLKLPSRLSNSAAMDNFLYAPAKDVLTKSPSDEVACRSLAIFYVRVLQLVAALTMSIYSPPDLISRIRNRVYETSLKLQQRGIKEVLSKDEQAARRLKRELWLMNMMEETEKLNVYTLGEKTQFRYDKITHNFTYNNQDNEYVMRLEVKEPEDYSVAKKYLTENTYWIEITNLYTDERDKQIVYRALVDGNGGGWLFYITPDRQAVEEEPFTGYYEDWSMDLEANILNNNSGVKATVSKKNNSGYNMYKGYGQMPGRATRRNGQRNTQKNGTKQLTKRNLSTIVKEKSAQNALDLDESSSLPPRFRESFRGMTKWLVEIPNWTESSPATYRATLIYTKPALPTGSGTTYACVDKWASQSLRAIAPFASLEALLFDKDDGTASAENIELLKTISLAFNKIYREAPVGNSRNNRPSVITDFSSVFMPSVGKIVEEKFCIKRTAQGDAVVEERYAELMGKAQDLMIKNYKEHLDDCYALLKTMFVMERVGSENVIKFTDDFINAKKGARNELEDNIIPTAITLIGNHYTFIEKLYFDTLNDLMKVK